MTHVARIEVIDQYGGRHRFPAEGHYYEWRLKPGTIDIEGNEFLDIFRRCDDGEDEYEVIATFPRPARAGVVTDTTCLSMPLRELQMEKCPRCGFITRPNVQVEGAEGCLQPKAPSPTPGCEGCGVYLGEAVDYPRRCKQCEKDQRVDALRTATHTHHREQKTPCPTCGKRVKIVGLTDHMRDAHGVRPNVELTGAAPTEGEMKP